MRKSMHVMVNLEPLIYVAFEQLVLQEAASDGNVRGALAAKCRKLIINELIEREVITQQQLLEACL